MTKYRLKYVFISLLGLLVSVKIAGQSRHLAGNNFESRNIFYFDANPYPYLFSTLYNSDGEVAALENLNNLLFRFNIHRYRPNQSLEYRVGVGYQARDFSVIGNSPYFINSSSLILSPRLFVKIKPSVVSPSNISVDLGLDLDYLVFRNGLNYTSSSGFNRLSKMEMDQLKSLKTYLTLGVSVNQLLINHGPNQPLGRLGLEFGIPLFNQANIFRNRNFQSDIAFSEFKNSRTESVRVGFNYTKSIGPRNNSVIPDTSFTEVGGAVFHRGVRRFIPPLFDSSNPKFNFHGRPYLRLILRQPLDSIGVTFMESKRPVSFSSSASMELGYNLYFHFPNFKRFISEVSRSETQIKGSKWDFAILTGGFYRRSYNSFSLGQGRVVQPVFGLNAGLKIGRYERGGYLLVWYSRGFEIGGKTIFNGVVVDDVLAPEYLNSINLALSFRNFLSGGVSYMPDISTLTELPLKESRKLSFFVSFGF